MLYFVLFLGEFIATAWSSEIVSGPVTVTNATVGGAASFECVLNTGVFPRWNINGRNYHSINLPPGIYFTNSETSSGYSNVLTFDPITLSHNNTSLYCFLINSGVLSTTAKLIIPPQNPISYHNQTTSLSIKPTTPDSIVSVLIATHSHSQQLNLSYTIVPKLCLSYTTLSSLIPQLSSSPVARVVKNSHGYSNILLKVSTGVATAVCTMAVLLSFLIFALYYCHHKNKSDSKQKKRAPVYEDVTDPVPTNPVLRDNPAYANPQRIIRTENNPAYVVISNPQNFSIEIGSGTEFYV